MLVTSPIWVYIIQIQTSVRQMFENRYYPIILSFGICMVHFIRSYWIVCFLPFLPLWVPPSSSAFCLCNSNLETCVYVCVWCMQVPHGCTHVNMQMSQRRPWQCKGGQVSSFTSPLLTLWDKFPTEPGVHRMARLLANTLQVSVCLLWPPASMGLTEPHLCSYLWCGH